MKEMMRQTLVPCAAVVFLLGSCILSCRADMLPAADENRVLSDWMAQDAGGDAGKCFTDGERSELEGKIVKAALDEIPDTNPELASRQRDLRKELDKLTGAGVAGNDPQWKALYVKACELRRAHRLGTLLSSCRRLVFTKHYNMGGSHYAYTEGQSDAQAERHFRPGSSLCLLEMAGPHGKVEVLLEDKTGVIRDPDVSYDGTRILFSWKKSDREDDYHLYEMDLATRSIRQITGGIGFADYEGCYLPNGEIMFNSTRCVQIVDCWWTEVSNLYVCDKDGNYMRRLGFDQVHSNYPQVLDDGRVIYTRWDYNDRGQLYPQPLFQMNIDGTGQTEYYGNNSWWPTTVGHARGIPGSDKIIAIATGHHSLQCGALLRIDVKEGRQEQSGATLVAPLVLDKKDRRYSRVDAYTGFDGHFMYPYALNEQEYIASYSAHQTGRDSMNGYDLCYVREDAVREVLAHDPEISCNQPVPLKPRKIPSSQPSVVDYRKTTGTYFLQDIYFGPGLKDIPRGTVKKLRVIALDFRAAGVGSNGNGGPAGGALVSTPVSINNGTWDVKLVLGDADVYEDGSAFFEVPARMPVYFQAIDADGYAVQSMRSWSTLMPGENFGCIGCHESKDAVPPTGGGITTAMRKGAQKLKPFYGSPRGFSFRKEIQPILDKHCVSCHYDRTETMQARKQPQASETDDAKAGGKEEQGTAADGAPSATPNTKKAFSLLGEPRDTRGGRNWSDAYLALTQGGPNEMVKWLNVQSIPPMLPPYFAGSARSKLPQILKEGHYEVKLSAEEMDKICCWIDLLVPYCGDYMEANAWNEGGRQKYLRFQQKREKMEAMEMDNIEAFIQESTGKAFTLKRKPPLYTFPDPDNGQEPALSEVRVLALENDADLQQ